MRGRVGGLLATGLVILAWLIVWNFLIRTWAAKHPESAAARGALYVI